MKRAIQTVVGLLIGAAALWLLFRDTDWPEVFDAMAEMNYGWFFVAQIPLWLSFPVRVQRWSYIVRAVHPVSFRSLFNATQLGFLANFTLPARAGEVIRAVVLSRLTPLPFAKSFALAALDRVSDLFGLITVMLIAVFAYRPIEDVFIPNGTFSLQDADIVFPAARYQAGAYAAGGFLFVVLGTFVLMYLNRPFVLRLSDAVWNRISRAAAARIHGLLDHFADGLDVFRSPGDMLKALALSLATWLCGLLFFVVMIRAFHFDVPWYTAFIMEAMLAVAISVPGAPGFVGQYHVPIVLTLVMIDPGVDINGAKALAIVTHLMNYPPLIAFGAYALVVDWSKIIHGETGRG